MNNLKEFLIEALKERFTAAAKLKAIEKAIEAIAEDRTYQKYKNIKIQKRGLEFGLLGVRASFEYSYDVSIECRKVNITLGYICISKSPKVNRYRVNREKEAYRQRKRFETAYQKDSFCCECSYTLDVDKILEDNINLEIK